MSIDSPIADSFAGLTDPKRVVHLGKTVEETPYEILLAAIGAGLAGPLAAATSAATPAASPEAARREALNREADERSAGSHGSMAP